ncbi:hypothetical protein BC830DRAFT_1167045 [Chytriomyces sp. MP71]|nr:hypothetical protein BC830DRAFT_1167045 [Chytriomyces sp. MP71]
MINNVARTALSQPVRTVVENGTPTVINSNLNTLKPYSLPTGKSVDIGGLMYNYDAATGYIKQGDSCLNTSLAVSDCGGTSLKWDATTWALTNNGQCLDASGQLGVCDAPQKWTIDYQYAPLVNVAKMPYNVVNSTVTENFNLAIDYFGHIFFNVQGDGRADTADNCLGANSIVAGAQVIVSDCIRGYQIPFFINKAGFVQTSSNGKAICLDVVDGLLKLSTCSGKDSQKFAFQL